MVRVSDVLEDTSPLDGDVVDVAARVGWVLRMARTAGGVALRSMPALLEPHGVALSPATLSRLETGGQRDGRVIDAYERVLGLTPGTLRAPIDVFCRHLAGAPADRAPGPGEPDLLRFSRRVDAVLADEPGGAAWMAFAAEHASARGFGITDSMMAPLVGRLAVELAQSAGTALITRVEAVARLRSGPYAGVVGEVIAGLDLPTRARALHEVVGAVAERPSRTLLGRWAGLLEHRSPRTLSFAALALERSASGARLEPADWQVVVAPFVAAVADAAAGDSPDHLERRLVLAHLFRALPPDVRRAISAARGGPVPRAPGPVDWTRTRRNVHHEYAVGLMRQACAEAGVPEQPMLARLLFEVLYEFRINRFGTAWGTIAATPFPAPVTRLLAEAATDAGDAATRHGARNGVVMLAGCAGHCPGVDDWLASGDLELRRTAHLVLGLTGRAAPDQALLSDLEGETALAHDALHGAGLAGHPLLARVRDDPARPAWARERAAWWLQAGALITR